MKGDLSSGVFVLFYFECVTLGYIWCNGSAQIVATKARPAENTNQTQ